MARPRAQDYDRKRLAILDSSAELFAHYGFHGTSMTMIADAGKVSKALFYHYYADKEAVLFDILRHHLQELIEHTSAAAKTSKNPKERLFAICTALLDAYRDADAKHQVQIANLRLLPRRKQEALRAMERTLVDLFSGAIAGAVPELKGSALLKPITMSLFGMLNWHYLWFRDGKGLTRAQYARMVAELIACGSLPAMRAAKAAPRPADVSQKRRKSAPKR